MMKFLTQLFGIGEMPLHDSRVLGGSFNDQKEDAVRFIHKWADTIDWNNIKEHPEFTCAKFWTSCTTDFDKITAFHERWRREFDFSKQYSIKDAPRMWSFDIQFAEKCPCCGVGTRGGCCSSSRGTPFTIYCAGDCEGFWHEQDFPDPEKIQMMTPRCPACNTRHHQSPTGDPEFSQKCYLCAVEFNPRTRAMRHIEVTREEMQMVAMGSL